MDKYFEGTYRRTPQQNLAGASRTCDASELINKVQVERRKREEARLLLEKATIIQSGYRGYLCRKHWKLVFKKQLELKLESISQDESTFTINDLYYLLQRLAMLFPKAYRFKTQPISPEDMNCLLYLTKLLQNVKVQVINAMCLDRFWIWRIIRFLILIMRIMNNMPEGQEEKLLPLLRVLSTFLDVEQYSQVLCGKCLPVLILIFSKLLTTGGLINTLIVSLDLHEKYTDETFNEVLHIAGFICKKAIEIINTAGDENFRELVLRIIGQTIINPPLRRIASGCFLGTLRTMEDFPLAEFARVYLKDDKQNITPDSLFRVLYLDKDQCAIPLGEQSCYFELLSQLLFQLYNLHKSEDSDNNDPDSESSSTSKTVLTHEETLKLRNALNLLNTLTRTDMWVRYLNKIIDEDDYEKLIVFCKCLHLIWISGTSPIYTHRIIKSVAFHPKFLKVLWKCILEEKRINHMSTPPQTFYTWNLLAHGVALSPSEAERIIPCLTMFCFFLKHHIAILNDSLLYEDETNDLPDFIQFKLQDIIKIASMLKDVSVGLISLAYPTFSFHGNDRVELSSPTTCIPFNLLAWRSLLEEGISLLRLVYIRDSRRQFTNNGFWLSTGSPIITDIRKPASQIASLSTLIPFSSATGNYRPLNVYEDRYLATLRCIPFVIDFIKRFMLLQHLINEVKAEYQNPNLHFFHASYVLVQIRRNYIYEDAFEKLNSEEVPECRIHIKVHMVSELGTEEAGIDGGGLFREFLIELLKTAFDPNRGFFLMNRANELYPNPNIGWIERDYVKHYSFIGRMLGKAIYENILVEIPLAEFFLAKLLGNKCDLHLNGLASLDPDMYRNLMSLMTYNGDFADLGLDFSLSLEYFGSNKIVELIQNGANIPVTKDNLLEYIQLVAHFKIHVQIKRQTEAFLEGLESVIPLEWLSIFSTKELQLIISGNETPIDIADMRVSAVYAGGYNDKHPTIEMFWRVVSSFENSQKSQLLKFVTSCSRPPLLGFKELYPPFCIQYMDNDSMLPSASTCMNILKLPNFQDEETMRQKILYAISSGAGFELL